VQIVVDERNAERGEAAGYPSPDGRRPRAAGHSWGLAALVGCLLLFAVSGVPFNPETIVLFLTFIVLVDALGRQGVPGVTRVVVDWGPVLAILVLYDLTRSIADTMGMPLQLQLLVDADKLLFFGHVPTEWLQQRILEPEAQWWEAITAVVYVSHFFACFGLAGWFYIRNRVQWRRFINRFLTLNIAGMVTYVLVPAAPPWYAGVEGALGPVARTTSRGFDLIGLKQAGTFLSDGQGMVNHVAAMPSLHGGYSFLFALFLWPFARRTRPLLVLYPIAMGFTLVYSGEHYVIDILMGWLYAWLVHLGWNTWEARKAQQATVSSDEVPDSVLVQPQG
jgi:membrane-associated phospholipid phosphatase